MAQNRAAKLYADSVSLEGKARSLVGKTLRSANDYSEMEEFAQDVADILVEIADLRRDAAAELLATTKEVPVNYYINFDFNMFWGITVKNLSNWKAKQQDIAESFKNILLDVFGEIWEDPNTKKEKELVKYFKTTYKSNLPKYSKNW